MRCRLTSAPLGMKLSLSGSQAASGDRTSCNVSFIARPPGTERSLLPRVGWTAHFLREVEGERCEQHHGAHIDVEQPLLKIVKIMEGHAGLPAQAVLFAGTAGWSYFLRSSSKPSRISSRSASSSGTEREPTSACRPSISLRRTSGLNSGDPSTFHQAVMGPVNCSKKCSMPPGPPPK